MLNYLAFFLSLGGMIMSSPAAAVVSEPDRAALLFAYRISDAQKFDEEYREHLGWHRDHNDHLAWYGWYVIAGQRTGMFVDGTFGSDFAAIDRRPDLKEDAVHFREGAARYSTPVQYSAWALWRGPSNDFSLEDQKPTPFIDALVATVRYGETQRFERALEKAGRGSAANGLHWTWYRATAGEKMSSYLILVPRRNWAELAGRPLTLGGMAAKAYGLGEAEAHALDKLIDTVEMETWSYRADLSLFPAKS